MDIQLALICVTIAIISALILYLISISTMKEKTYDEAMADFRKKTESQFTQGRSSKDKLKDKKEKKKAGKKVKEKNAGGGSNEQSDVDGSNKTRVVFVEPEIILDEKVVVEEKKKAKKKEKPILLNKNDANFVAATPAPIHNHFDQIHPKDDLELKRSHSREEIPQAQCNNTEYISLSATPSKESGSQKHNKHSSKVNIAATNKNSAEPKAEKQQQQQPNQQQPAPTKNPKQSKSEKNNVQKADKNTSANTVNQPTVINSFVADVKESVILPKHVNNKQQQAPPVKQPVSTSENNPPVIQQQSQNNDKLMASPSVKLSKKKRNELATFYQISGDREAVNISLLMPLVRKAELSKSEIQLLIDFLLNKQQGFSDGSSEWIEGRQDPVLKLKKQLAEKEKALSDELEASIGFQTRLKELRTELNAEKHNVRTLEEALHARQAEISSFAMKLQHAVEEKQALAQQIQQVQAKSNEERLLLRKLQEDGSQAQNVLKQEFLAQRQQLEMHIARLSESQVQQQETIATLEAQLGNQIQEHESLNGELNIMRERASVLQEKATQAQELARQVDELRGIRSNLEHMVKASQFETGRLQNEVKQMSDQSNQLKGDNEQLNNAVQTLQNDNSRLRETNERLNIQVSSASVEARQLRDENESLAAQVTASMERPATEGRENGESNNYNESKPSIIVDQDNIQKKDLLIEEMSSQLKTKEVEVKKLTGEVNSYKTEILDQQRLIQSLKEDIKKHQIEVKSLTNDLVEQRTEVSRLMEQLNNQHAKNNDLRTKNWKVMEALSSTEKLLQNKMNESNKVSNDAVKCEVKKTLLEQQTYTRQLLLRVFPEIVVPECKGQRDWYEQIEKVLKHWKPQQSNDNENASFAELEKQNIQLQAMVNHYKNIIADTEGILNRLQRDVEQEEGKWSEELDTLRSQLEAVTKERDALQQASSGTIQRETNGFNHVDDGCGNE